MAVNKHERITKILSIFAFIFIISELIIIIKTPSAQGYEISIYYAYPWYFWLFIIISIVLGQAVVLKNIFFKPTFNENHKLWVLGFVVIILPIIILLFMPYFRDYLTYGRGDHLFHLGSVKNIFQTASIRRTNFYPNLHILTAILKNICNCNLINIANFLSRYFFFLSPISFYIFFRTIFKKKNEAIFALTLVSSVMFFGSFGKYLAPCPNSFLFTTIALYLYFKIITVKNSRVFSVLFIVFITSYTLYHPLNSLLLIIFFLIMLLILHLPKKYNHLHWIKGSVKNIKRKSVSAFLFSSIIWLVWYFSFSYIARSFNKVFSSIFYGTGESFFTTKTDIINTYNPKIFDLIELTIYKYGTQIIIGIVSISCLTYVLYRWHKNKKTFNVNPNEKSLTFRLRDKLHERFSKTPQAFYSIEKKRLYLWHGKETLKFCFLFSALCFLVFCILSAGAFWKDFIVEWSRFFRWATIFSFIFTSILFYLTLSNSKNRKGTSKSPFKSLKFIIVFILLTSLLFLSTFTFYRSPKIMDENQQVTKMEWEGMGWFFENNNNKNYIYEIGINVMRFNTAIWLKEDSEIIISPRLDMVLQDHFGYENNSSSGSYFNENMYLLITTLGKIRYPELHPNYKEYWSFTPKDFNKLKNDDNLLFVYTNDNLEVYLTRRNEV